MELKEKIHTRYAHKGQRVGTQTAVFVPLTVKKCRWAETSAMHI